MYQFSLEWVEEGRKLSQTFSAKDDTKQKGKFLIGRDEKQCDIVINDSSKSVSRLHAAICYDSQKHQLLLKNLTINRPNPNSVIVDGKAIVLEEVPLSSGSVIKLGRISITIKNIEWTQAKQVYGLQCVNGHFVSYDYVGDFCPHCGVSLQAQGTVILPNPNQ